MRCQKRIFFILILVCTCSFGQVNPAKKNSAAKESTVVFFDDFTGNKLDRSKWNAEITGMHVNDELQAYVDSTATIYLENNSLVLQPRYAPGFITGDGQKFDFVSGRINTKNKFDFKYGTVEARIKLNEGSGLWPAWWMLGYGNWPETGEIDIMEYVGEKDWASAAVHGPGYSGETPFVNRLYFDKKNDVTCWHIYGVDWTADSLLFKYDGVTMFRVTKTMVSKYGKWSFDNNKFLILNYALGGAYPEKINAVKSPFYGLSSTAFELIKNNKIKMSVDWIRVTKK